MDEKIDEKISSEIFDPTYYKGKKISAIDVIEDFELDFCLGNAIKYILRANLKGGSIDLKKAIWYLQRIVKKWDKNPS